MAITINHNTNVISVPQADLTLITGTLYELDTNTFRLNVLALLDDADGMPLDDVFIHNTAVTVAGTTFARTIEVLVPYSIQFTPDSQYSVRLVGSNNNIFDVENSILVQNQVQVIPTNSAGLIVSAQTELTEMWRLMGLDISNPMTVTPTTRDAGASISQTISGDGVNTTTVTRDP